LIPYQLFVASALVFTLSAALASPGDARAPLHWARMCVGSA